MELSFPIGRLLVRGGAPHRGHDRVSGRHGSGRGRRAAIIDNGRFDDSSAPRLAHQPTFCGRDRYACSSCRRRRSERSTTWPADAGAPVFTVEGKYRRAAGPSGRRASSSARRCCSSTPPATARFSSWAARARSSAWRRTSRTSASTITASTTSAPTAACGASRARGASTPTDVGDALLRAGAEGQRRRAGAALDARCPTAGSSTRSTARIRCSSTRSARCARSRSAHRLGHRLIDEQDAQVNLLERLLQHARATARVQRLLRRRPRRLRRARPRRARERCSTSPTARYRGPSSQQGYSPFTHVDARAGLGDARLRRAARVPRRRVPDDGARAARRPRGDRAPGCSRRRARPATSTSITRRAPTACRTGTPARPGSRALGDWASRAADPFNDHEPVDSSAAAIARAGAAAARPPARARAARTARATRRPGCACSTRCSIRAGPYLSSDADASRACSCTRSITGPTAGTTCPPGRAIPRGESSQWGDYHAREAALTCKRLATGGPYLTFFGPERRVTDARPVALVTGGTRGIGLGIARALAARRLGSRALRRARRRPTSTPSSTTLAQRRRDACTTCRPTSAQPADRARARRRRRDALRRASTRSSTTPAARRASAPICSRRPRRASRS